MTDPGDQSSTVGVTLALPITATDADGDPLLYSASGLPPTLVIGSASGVISGTVTTAGTYNVTVAVDDGNGGASSVSFDWAVASFNTPPSVSNPGAQSGSTGETVNLAISASDPNGDVLSFSATGLPPGLGLDGASGVISGTLAANGNYVVTVTVTDGIDASSASFVWTVGALVQEDFESGTGGFAYLDDPFRGTATPVYASGARLAGAGLQVLIGGVDDEDIFGMSGGWQRDFVLNEARGVTISFRYRLTQSSEYEGDEFSQALVSLDGQLQDSGSNDYLAQLTGDGNGGPAQSTGWQQVAFDIADLPAGTHSLIIGGYSNIKTYNDETTEVLIADLLVVAQAPGNPGTP